MNENEIISKAELSKMLHELNIAVNEGTASDKNKNIFPRLIYWPYVEEDVVASGEGYQNLSTYQISFFARTPQHEKYKELRRKLREKGFHPKFYHEYVEIDTLFEKTWHTYFSIEVLEEIEEEQDE